MKILVVNNAEPQDRDYNMLLMDAVSQFVDADIVDYRELTDMQESIANYGGVILSGVPVHYDYDTIDARLPYLQWIQEVQIPVLGICLGHENIGRLYGAAIYRDTESEHGLCSVQTMRDDPLLEGIESGDEIFASHRASMSVPEGFMLLASTANCRNHIMKHAAKPIYGLQFHPELSETGIKMLGNFAKLAAACKTTLPIEMI
jgi:GMP synthase (glutamine-hydrolysing)